MKNKHPVNRFTYILRILKPPLKLCYIYVNSGYNEPGYNELRINQNIFSGPFRRKSLFLYYNLLRL